MAQIETWLKCDLKHAVKVHKLPGDLFYHDNQANLIGVEVFDNGVPASVSGTVTAKIIRDDNSTITATGSASGNRVSVILPADAYAVPGKVSIVIKLTASGVVTTVASVVGNVFYYGRR